MSQGLPLHLPTSLVKASAGKQPPPCPKGRWLNSKAAPWDYRLSLEVPLPGICFINCICSAFFFFLLYCLPLQGDTKGTLRCCLERRPASPSDSPFPFCRASCGSARRKQSWGGQKRCLESTHRTRQQCRSGEGGRKEQGSASLGKNVRVRASPHAPF